MKLEKISKVLVIGAGLMGHGIAEVFALSGYHAILEDISAEMLTKAKIGVEKSLERMLKSGKIDQARRDQILSLVSYSQDLAASAKDADLIIEAVPEVVDLKRSVLQSIGKVAKAGSIIATNTSNISISDLASSVPDPTRFLGMHFFNPPVVMKLVEVIRGEKTSDDVFEGIYALSRELGKTPIKVFRDSAGFVVNRISAPEGLYFSILLDEGIAKPEEVDAFAKSQGLPMGVYELMDYVGIDTVVHSMEYYTETLSKEFSRHRVLSDMMKQNHLGLKTGKGFYNWKDGKADIPQATPTDKVQLMDIFAIDVNEAVRIIEEGVAAPTDIENGVKLGLNRPFGPISVAESLTSSEVGKKLEDIATALKCDYFKPAPSIAEGKLKDAIAVRAPAPVKEPASTEIAPNAQATSTPPPVGTDLIQVRREGAVTFVEFNNGRLNLLNKDMLDSLEKTIAALQQDKESRVVVLRGKSGVFSAGAELSQFFSGGMDFLETDRRGQRIFRSLTELRQVTIAEISGYCLGGGFELAIACDIRIASDAAEMGLPEVTRGLVPGWGGTQRLPRLIGASRAAFMVLTGERVKGIQAMNLGLVWEITSPDTLENRVKTLAQKVATEVAPVSAALAKSLIYKGSEGPILTGLEMEAISMGVLFGTDDIKEGVSAFMQKRKAEFKGK